MSFLIKFILNQKFQYWICLSEIKYIWKFIRKHEMKMLLFMTTNRYFPPVSGTINCLLQHKTRQNIKAGVITLCVTPVNACLLAPVLNHSPTLAKLTGIASKILWHSRENGHLQIISTRIYCCHTASSNHRRLIPQLLCNSFSF
jgi:hypothetical protein